MAKCKRTVTRVAKKDKKNPDAIVVVPKTVRRKASPKWPNARCLLIASSICGSGRWLCEIGKAKWKQRVLNAFGLESTP